MKTVQSAFLVGLKPIFTQVELVRYRGIPQLVMVGLASKAVVEAKERLRSAIKSLGVKIPHVRFVFNLTPADISKQSSCLDLALAVAMLKELGIMPVGLDEKSQLWIGELGLDGSVRGVRGALSMALAAQAVGFTQVWCSAENARELELVSGLKVMTIGHLRDLLPQYASKPTMLKSRYEPVTGSFKKLQAWRQLSGMQLVKRALVLAAAGWHHLLLTGPPGIGKTSIAQSLVELLPPLPHHEALEVANIQSLVGVFRADMVRPLRVPAQTISASHLLGSPNNHYFGEVTLAHRGVLFLDELVEFPSHHLELLRQPLETGMVSLGNTQQQNPAQFLLVAATNPCRCGYYGSRVKSCHCSTQVLQQYQQKLSGPWLDRIDLAVQVGEKNEKIAIQPTELGDDVSGLIPQIAKARQKQAERWGESRLLNGQVIDPELLRQLTLAADASLLLDRAVQQLKLSHRGYWKVIKVARTIMDLMTMGNGREPISTAAIAEALQYRTMAQTKRVS